MKHSSCRSSSVLCWITILIISCGFFHSSYAIRACYTKEMSYSNSQGETRSEYYTSCNHGSNPAPRTGVPPGPSQPHAPVFQPAPFFPPVPVVRPAPLFPPVPIVRPAPLFPPGLLFPPPAFPGGN